MVKKNLRITEDWTETNHMVLNEFYGLKCLTQDLSQVKYCESFIKFLLKFLKKPPRFHIEAIDPDNRRYSLILGYIHMLIINQNITIPQRFIINNIRKLFDNEIFKLVYYLSCKVIFSLPINVISKKLGLRCCNRSNHYSFCEFKWKELEKYTIFQIPTSLGCYFISSYRLSDIISNIFIN